jgi:hypothetical protein
MQFTKTQHLDYDLTNATSQIGCDKTVKIQDNHVVHTISWAEFLYRHPSGERLTRVSVSVGQNLLMNNEHDDPECVFANTSNMYVIFCERVHLSRILYIRRHIFTNAIFVFRFSRIHLAQHWLILNGF